jgi:hypothetical protein
MNIDEITKIKAELFDLQNHYCNGRLVVGNISESKCCTYCSRIIELQNRLKVLLGTNNVEYRT